MRILNCVLAVAIIVAVYAASTVGEESTVEEGPSAPLIDTKPIISPDVRVVHGNFSFVNIIGGKPRVHGTFTESTGKVWRFQSEGALALLLNTPDQTMPKGGVDAIVILKKDLKDEDFLTANDIVAVFSRGWLASQGNEEHYRSKPENAEGQ